MSNRRNDEVGGKVKASGEVPRPRESAPVPVTRLVSQTQVVVVNGRLAVVRSLKAA